MRVLVTGGAGFIGSHLTDALLARGDEVTVLDDLSAGHLSRLDPAVTLHKVSVTDPAALAAVVADAAPDLIFHLAAQIDVRVSVNLLEAARTAGARVLFASSGGALYGHDAPIPSLEDVAPLPESPYGIAKYCAEQYIGLYNRLHGTAHSALRLANVYGPRQDPAGEAGVIALFCSAALAGRAPTIYGDGTQTRDYVYVGDVVRAFLAAADAGRPGVWNVGTATEVSVLDLVGIIAAIAGRPLRPDFAAARPGELLRSVVAVERAAADLGWRAQMPLSGGVERVYRWIEGGAAERAAC